MRRSTAQRVLSLGSVLFAALATTSPASAAEVESTAGAVGVSDIRAAELPPVPGLYVGGGGVFSNIYAINDNEGRSVFPATHGTINSGFGGALFVYPGEVFGGRVASSIGFSYTHHKVTASNGGFRLASDNYGFGDIYSDVFYWSKGFYDPPPADPALLAGIPPLPTGFAVAFGLGVTAPVGRYRYDALGNPGFDSWILSPNIAFTYRTKPYFLDGTEFSTRFFYNAVLEREDRGRRYNDGNYVSIDWALTERWNRFQFGPTGNFAIQVEDDTANRPVVNGRYTNSIKLGALVAVDFPEYAATLQLKYLRDVHAENNLSGELYIVRLAFKAF